MLSLVIAPIVAGVVLAWSLAAPPGPANAFIAHETARRGWAAGVATGLGAIAGDAVMFLLMWGGVLRVVAAVPWLQVMLAAVGAVLMVRFAWGAWRSGRDPALDSSRRGSFPKTFVVIITSPFNWGWWLTVGTTLFANLGGLVMAGFFGGLLAWVMTWAGLALLGRSLFRRFAEGVAYASAVVLLVFAFVVGWYALREATRLLG